MTIFEALKQKKNIDKKKALALANGDGLKPFADIWHTLSLQARLMSLFGCDIPTKAVKAAKKTAKKKAGKKDKS